MVQFSQDLVPQIPQTITAWHLIHASSLHKLHWYKKVASIRLLHSLHGYK